MARIQHAKNSDSEAGVGLRRQILTANVGPRAERVNYL